MNLRKAVMQPGCFNLNRYILLFVLFMKRQQPLHFRIDLLRRTILVHAAVGLFGVVGTLFVFAFEQSGFEKISELVSYSRGVLVLEQGGMQLVDVALGKRPAAL